MFQQVNKIFKKNILHKDSYACSVYCISNIDCESLSGSTVCKENVAGGAKTCQASTTCTQDCSIGEFCDSANMCQNGNTFFYKNETLIF